MAQPPAYSKLSQAAIKRIQAAAAARFQAARVQEEADDAMLAKQGHTASGRPLFGAAAFPSNDSSRDVPSPVQLATEEDDEDDGDDEDDDDSDGEKAQQQTAPAPVVQQQQQQQQQSLVAPVDPAIEFDDGTPEHKFASEIKEWLVSGGGYENGPGYGPIVEAAQRFIAPVALPIPPPPATPQQPPAEEDCAKVKALRGEDGMLAIPSPAKPMPKKRARNDDVDNEEEGAREHGGGGGDEEDDGHRHPKNPSAAISEVCETLLTRMRTFAGLRRWTAFDDWGAMINRYVMAWGRQKDMERFQGSSEMEFVFSKLKAARVLDGLLVSEDDDASRDAAVIEAELASFNPSEVHVISELDAMRRFCPPAYSGAIERFNPWFLCTTITAKVASELDKRVSAPPTRVASAAASPLRPSTKRQKVAPQQQQPPPPSSSSSSH